MKISYPFLLFILFLISCNSTKNNHKIVRFGLGDKICLEGKEQLQPTSKSDVIEYEQNCVPVTVSIPLNRTIQAGNYQIYIGIPVATTLDKFSKAVQSHHKDNILVKRSPNAQTKEFFIKSAYLYNYQMIYKTKAKNVFVFNLVSKDSSLVKRFYNQEYFKKKLNCAKQKKSK